MIGIAAILFPEEVLAQNQGLIPCGGDDQDPCTLCHLFILVRNIFNFALQLLASVATLSIVIGGGMMVLSNGNPSLFKQGLTAVQNAIVGILLTLAFFVFFSFGLEALGFQQSNVVLNVDGNDQGFQFTPGQFFKVTCDTADYLNSSDRSFGSAGSSGGGNDGGGRVGDIPVGANDIACLANDSISDELSAVMRAISYYEGAEDPGSYFIAVGGKVFDGGEVFESKETAVHPGIITCCNSTAFGRFQMIDTTWDAWASAAGISETGSRLNTGETRLENKTPPEAPPNKLMIPPNQDLAVEGKLKENGITDGESFMNNDFRCKWASIEGPDAAGCSQPNDRTRNTDFMTLYQELLEDEQNGTCS